MRTAFLLPIAAALTAAAAFSAAADDTALSVKETDEAITIQRGETPVLTYHKAVVPPPEGRDPAFARSGFIHPLCAPSGAPVTGVHPDDHIHHLGLWHAWVKTKHGGKGVDFWNLKEKTGAVRFAKSLGTKQDGGAVSFSVEQEQVALNKGPEPVAILRETLTVAARFEGGANVIDYTLVQKNVTDEPLKLPAYRYGGPIAYRAPENWNKENSDYLTSEGKRRADSHATRAKWVAMHGPAGGEVATMAILCHSGNHDAPQRIRTWPDGRIFFNYVPIQETGWEIKAGEEVTMRYRIIIAPGKPEAAKLDAAFEKFGAE
ncbi:MAG: PmoA family protein [Verrucomicrobiales bacterium]